MTKERNAGSWLNASISGIVAGIVFALTRANLEGSTAFLVSAFAFAFFIQNRNFNFSAMQKITAAGLMFVIGFYWNDVGREFLPGGKFNPISYKTALLNLQGDITDDTPSSADTVIAALRAAYSRRNTKAVILKLNSSGGSMVQASNIYNEIRRLQVKYPTIPLYAVIGDVCTSACYYVAAAANEIYANPASLVGLIGVPREASLTNNVIKELKPEQIKRIQNDIQQQFIKAVRTGRGMRLSNSDKVFSEPWAGEQIVILGLVDGFGDASYVARVLIGAKNIVKY